MSVSQLEEAYQQLREQMLRGELDEAEFKAEAEQLRFEDDQGNQWKIGWYTGKWYRYDQGQWVQDTPPERQAIVPPSPVTGGSPPAEEGRRRRSMTPCLVVGLIAVLVLASVVLVFGWNADWWGKATEEATSVAEITATGTVLPAPSDTAEQPAPTATPRASSTASRTPAATATRRSPTATPKPATPTVEATGTTPPTATVTPSQTPSTEATRRPSPSAAPSLSGSIYFPVYDANPERRTFDVYAYRLDSGKREIVIGQASQPAISPNGKRLVYRSWNTAQRGILVRELTDGNTWPWISFHEAERPNWSPDSQNIVFSSQQESDRRWRLYRTWGLTSDRVRREGGDIYGRVPTWSPDGRIIYWECPMDKCGLYAMHTDGTNLTRLTVNENDTTPAISPNGNQLAFMSNADGNWEIYVTGPSPAGGQPAVPQRLTKNAARDGLPTWSPDGKWLAFVSDRDGSWAVWVMRANGSEQKKLFALGGSFEGEVADVPPTQQHGWSWESLAWGR